jgi:sulfur-oxidizing protein SoxY
MLDRRTALWGAAGLLPLGELLAANARAGFDTQGLAATLRALGLATPQRSAELKLDAPDVAENGAQVRVAVASTLPLRRLWLLAEKNPNTLVAAFELDEVLEPRLATQIKLAESGLVHAIGQLADGRLLIASKEVRVTLGGCAA